MPRDDDRGHSTIADERTEMDALRADARDRIAGILTGLEKAIRADQIERSVRIIEAAAATSWTMRLLGPGIAARIRRGR